VRRHTPTLTTLFPYTTLFRSYHDPYIDIPDNCIIVDDQGKIKVIGDVSSEKEYVVCINRIIDIYTNLKETRAIYYSRYTNDILRSEEHTSELQSRFDLVCRLL